MTDEEFPACPPLGINNEVLQASARKARACATQLFGNTTNNLSLAGSLGTVFCIGVFEGMLLTRRGATGRASFCARYGAAQVLPSIIWMTKPAETLAISLGRSPTPLLRDLSLAAGTPAAQAAERATTSLRVLGAQTARSIIGGFLGIAQILRLVDSSTEASSNFRDRVAAGREPLFEGPLERVIRLSGTQSDVTELSVQRHGAHIVPIVEDTSHESVRRLVTSCSRDGNVPVVWHVPSGGYAKPHSWTGGAPDDAGEPIGDLSRAAFRVGRDWLLPAPTAANPVRRALIIEADSSVGEQALALSEESSNDLTLQESSQAFRMIERLARSQGALHPSDVVVRVLLADEARRVTSGGGGAMSLRSIVNSLDEADIIIDAQKPLIQAVLHWAARAASAGQRRVLFKTSNAEYFRCVQQRLERHGWAVEDFFAATTAHRRGGAPGGLAGVPVLVYESTTEDTVNTIESLVGRGLAQPDLTCALLDRVHGVGELRRLEAVLPGEVRAHVPKEGIASICSARIYDDLFARVRCAVRNGRPLGEIQAALDRDFGNA
jgi:hypothetical protein